MLDNREEAINNDLHLKSTRTIYDPPIMFDDVMKNLMKIYLKCQNMIILINR